MVAGSACVDLKRYGDAFVDFDKALALKPNLPGVEGARLSSQDASLRLEKF